MQTLRQELEALVSRVPDREALRVRLDSLVSIYPFNEYEYIISHLLAGGVLSIEQYQELRDSYIARNVFLYIFEISAPRTFGESWAQGHLKELVPELTKPSKRIDPNYSGEYDLRLDRAIRIEVKASRAVAADEEGPLYVRALSSDSASPFWMNFQQAKPACCDVFVLVAVWRDRIRYWVLSSNEVAASDYYSGGQHRGNVGEGQLHMRQDNIAAFDAFEARSDRLAVAIRAAYERQLGEAR